MATSNPKVSGYVPQHVFDRFERFYQERELSMSQAVTVILAEYFGLEQSTVTPGGLLLEKVESFGDSIGELLERVTAIESKLSGSSSEPLIQKQSTSSLSGEPLEIQVSWDAIVKRLGASKSTIERKKSGFEEWSREKDPDGIEWRMVKDGRKLIFTSSNLNSELKSRLLKWLDSAGLSE
jgi:hypothetical protein